MATKTKKHGHKDEGAEEEPHIEKLSLGKTSVPSSPKPMGDLQAKKKIVQSQMKELTKNLEQDAYRIIFDMFPSKISRQLYI